MIAAENTVENTVETPKLGLSDYISEDLVLIGMDASDNMTCIDTLAKLLYEKGLAKESYIQAVKDREKVYPTGLNTNGVGVAIPHSDAHHANQPAVAIGTLAKPVVFHLMGDDEQTVDVQIVFQLLIKEPQEQLDMLQSLCGLFANDALLENILAAKTPAEIIALVNEAIATA